MWRKILKSQKAAKDFHQVEVKIDVSTSFWHDHWCNLRRLRGHIDLGIPATATVAEAISTHRCRHHRTGLLNKLEDELDKLRLVNHQGYNISLWRSRVDKFKNTWLQIREDFPLQSWRKVVWFKYATLKQSFHVWTAIRDRLFTCDRMKNWNSIKFEFFVVNTRKRETYLSFSCPFSSQV